MKKVFVNSLFLFTTGFGVEYAPWFSPLWEFQSHFSYFYRKENGLKKNTSYHNSIHSLDLGLGATVWPDWNAEVELLFSKSREICFTYESSFFTARTLVWDDRSGLDPLSLTFGATLFFPAHRFLHSFSFPYHGHANLEVHSAIGKEWERAHLWALVGLGFAERGYPWLHATISGDYSLTRAYELGIFLDSLIALAGHSLDVHDFHGYAHVAHKNIDIGAFWNWHMGCLGTLNFFIWDRIFSHNFVKNEWGVGVNLHIPFGL